MVTLQIMVYKFMKLIGRNDFCRWPQLKKVQVGKGQEKAQYQQKIPTLKARGEKKPN